MSDPLQHLKDLGRTMPRVAQPPAAQIRRRGDRMRQRRAVAGAASAAVLIAAFTAGGMALAPQITGSATRPAVQPSTPPPADPRWITEIPDNFPLGRGLPRSGGDVPEREVSDALDLTWQHLPCGGDGAGPPAASSYPADRARTDARYLHVQPPAENHARQLVLYPDADSAASVAAAILAQARGCGPNEAIPGITEFRWAVSRTQFGTRAGHLVSGGEFVTGKPERGPSRMLLAVLTVGNAVLVAELSDESSVPDPADLTEPDAKRWAAQVSAVADEMCRFAIEGCAGEGPVRTPRRSSR